MYEKTFSPPFGAFCCDLCCGSFYITSFFFSLSEAKTACFSKKHKCPLR